MFQENKYAVVREAVSLELINFVKDYFELKRKCVEQMLNIKLISPWVEYLGHWNDKMTPQTYSHYSDFAMEILLKRLKPTMEEQTGLKLYENVSYARIYKYGDILRRHKDRFSCEISTTLNIGGDPWPIYLDPTGGTGNEGVKVDLRPGDMLIYRGCDLEHWRYKFTGSNCYQVFLHYQDVNTEGAEENKYDSRPFLGLPWCFRR